MFDAATFADNMSKFIAACRASARTGETISQDTVAALLNGDLTVGTVDAMLVAKFKPRLPSGKTGTTRSSLRNAIGGETAKKAMDRIEKVFNAATPKAEISDGVPNTAGLAIGALFRPYVVAFATAADGAPKSMSALLVQLKSIESDYAKAQVPANDDNEGEDSSEGDAPTVTQETPIATAANRLRLMLAEATSEQIAEAQDALSALAEALSGTVADVNVEQEAIAA